MHFSRYETAEMKCPNTHQFLDFCGCMSSHETSNSANGADVVIDHCKAWLYGFPKYLVQRLQLVLNSAGRLLNLLCKPDHATSLLIQLHLLAMTAHRI